MANEILVTTTYITKTQAAAYLQVSEKTIERYSYSTATERQRIENSGKQPLRRYRFNGRSLYKLADIQALLEYVPNAGTDQTDAEGSSPRNDAPAIPAQVEHRRSRARPGTTFFPVRGRQKTQTPQLSMDFAEENA